MRRTRPIFRIFFSLLLVPVLIIGFPIALVLGMISGVPGAIRGMFAKRPV